MKRKTALLILFALVFSLLCASAEAAEKAKDSFDASRFDWYSTPKSTCFSYIGYDEDAEELAVIFRSNETRTYVYSEFDADAFDTFSSDSSLGGYYNKNIKGKYSCTRYDDAGTDVLP